MRYTSKILFLFSFSILSAGVVCEEASAASFDFVALAAGNEHGALTETFSNAGLSVTASAHALNNPTTPYHMYLDDLNGSGLPAGLGVCKNLTGAAQCSPGSDDNITWNEVLVLTFDQEVTINQIQFSNGIHTDSYLGNFGVAIDSTPLSVADFIQYATVPVFSLPLTGTVFSFISNVSISGITQSKRELYISQVAATAVPEPTSLVLLASAVLPLVRNRRLKKSSV